LDRGRRPELEEHLSFDISMALLKIKTQPRGDRNDIYRKMIAEQIICARRLLAPVDRLHGGHRAWD
jgi:hypothetical protein